MPAVDVIDDSDEPGDEDDALRVLSIDDPLAELAVAARDRVPHLSAISATVAERLSAKFFDILCVVLLYGAAVLVAALVGLVWPVPYPSGPLIFVAIHAAVAQANLRPSGSIGKRSLELHLLLTTAETPASSVLALRWLMQYGLFYTLLLMAEIPQPFRPDADSAVVVAATWVLCLQMLANVVCVLVTRRAAHDWATGTLVGRISTAKPNAPCGFDVMPPEPRHAGAVASLHTLSEG
jgi:uncharacterized RDD family membrane protein YckC